MRTHADMRPATAFDGKYLGLSTFRGDGTGVTTPVWFVPEDGRLLIETGAESYKVKRIGREPNVTVGLCSARGHMHTLPVPARAELLPDDEIPRVERLISRKYRLDMLFIKPFRAIQQAMGKPRERSVIVAVTPSPHADA